MYRIDLADKSLWEFYRSNTLGSPVLKEQAYGAVYNWIEHDDIYFHRSLESALLFFKHEMTPPAFLQEDFQRVLEVYNGIKNDKLRSYGNLGTVKPENLDKFRFNLLRATSEICVFNWENFPISSFNNRIYTNVHSMGAEKIVDDVTCAKLSRVMPLMCKRNDVYLMAYDKEFMNNVNWNNVWVFN